MLYDIYHGNMARQSCGPITGGDPIFSRNIYIMKDVALLVYIFIIFNEKVPSFLILSTKPYIPNTIWNSD